MGDGVPPAVAPVLVHLLAELAPEERRAGVEPAARLESVEEAPGHEERPGRCDEPVVRGLLAHDGGERRGLRVDAVAKRPAPARVVPQLAREEEIDGDQVRDAPGERRQLPRHASELRRARDPVAREADRDVIPARPNLRGGRQRRRDPDGEQLVEAVERDHPRLRLPARLPVDAPRKADRPAEVLEAPATECFGALEEGARLAQVLTSEPGEPWQERLAIARSRLDALSPPRRREERAQARRQARALSPMPNVQRLNVRHAASSPRCHSSRRHAARRVRRRCFTGHFRTSPSAVSAFFCSGNWRLQPPRRSSRSRPRHARAPPGAPRPPPPSRAERAHDGRHRHRRRGAGAARLALGEDESARRRRTRLRDGPGDRQRRRNGRAHRDDARRASRRAAAARTRRHRRRGRGGADRDVSGGGCPRGPAADASSHDLRRRRRNARPQSSLATAARRRRPPRSGAGLGRGRPRQPGGTRLPRGRRRHR